MLNWADLRVKFNVKQTGGKQVSACSHPSLSHIDMKGTVRRFQVLHRPLPNAHGLRYCRLVNIRDDWPGLNHTMRYLLGQDQEVTCDAWFQTGSELWTPIIDCPVHDPSPQTPISTSLSPFWPLEGFILLKMTVLHCWCIKILYFHP